MESFFTTLKGELVAERDYHTRDAARAHRAGRRLQDREHYCFRTNHELSEPKAGSVRTGHSVAGGSAH
jgi:hypothetical protein